MKVLYDYQILCRQRYGGISRYFYELISAIRRGNKVDAEIKCFFSKNKYFENELTNIFSHDVSFMRGQIFINKLYYRYLLKYKNYDIFHPTYFDSYYIDKCKGKVVITVYDMIYELYPELFGDSPVVIEEKRKCIEKADHIIAISQKTKDDLLKLYPQIPEGKVSVVYLAVSSDLNTKTVENLPDKYVLFVGNRGLYKNFIVLCKAMNEMMEEDSDLALVCVGGGKFTEEELKDIKYKDRVFQYEFTDLELNYLYQNAECFVFPSKYEGFGIPVLEAFANKCPVVLSRSSCFPEIGGDAALYFGEDDSKGLADCIKRMLDSNLRAEYIEKGLERVKHFSWDRTCEETIKVYESLL